MSDQTTPNEMDEMMDQDSPELYTLVDEDGNEQLFELIDILEENKKVYFALIPHVESGEDGSDILVPIEDDDEYERIANIFIDRLETYEEEDDENE